MNFVIAFLALIVMGALGFIMGYQFGYNASWSHWEEEFKRISDRVAIMQKRLRDKHGIELDE